MGDRLSELPVLGVGLGYRHELRRFIAEHRAEIGFLEVTAEHFFDDTRKVKLAELGASFPLLVHGLDMSLGTPGPLREEKLAAYAEVAGAASAKWVSEHIAFTRGTYEDGAELGHLLPVLPTPLNAEMIISHVREIESAVSVPLILENITSHLPLRGTLAEVDFINLILDGSGCGLLLDVTNLYINAVNHKFDPIAFLKDLKLSRVVEIHIVGFSPTDYGLEDFHSERIQDELLELVSYVTARTELKAILLERDDKFEDRAGILEDLRSLRRFLPAAEPQSFSRHDQHRTQ